jgi:hypothetical protein
MTIGLHLTDQKLAVRARPDRPAVEIPIVDGNREVEIHPLGLSIGNRAHLGFTPRPTAPDEDRHHGELPRRLTLDCHGHGKARPFADRGLGLRREDDRASPDAMIGVPLDRGGMVRWRQKGAAIEVRFLDGFAPGSPVRDARFTAPEGWRRPHMAGHHASVRNGRVALALEGGHTRILRSGSSASEVSLPRDASIRAMWLGDDGSLVAATHPRDDGPTSLHWSPTSATPTRALVGTVTATPRTRRSRC